MPIRFACADCGARIKVPDGSEGRKVRCPKCETSQRVPETSDFDTDPPADESDDAAAALAEMGEQAPALSLPSETDPPEAPAKAPSATDSPAKSDDDAADASESAAAKVETPAAPEPDPEANAPADSDEPAEAPVPASEPQTVDGHVDVAAVSLPEPVVPREDGKPIAMNRPGSEGGRAPKPGPAPRLIALLLTSWGLRLFAVLAVLATLQTALMERPETDVAIVSREASFIFGIAFAGLLWGVGEIAHAIRRRLRTM